MHQDENSSAEVFADSLTEFPVPAKNLKMASHMEPYVFGNNFGEYEMRLQQFFIVNGVSEKEKWHIAETFKFYKAEQGSRSVKDFIIGLKLLSEKCNFDAFLDHALSSDGKKINNRLINHMINFNDKN